MPILHSWEARPRTRPQRPSFSASLTRIAITRLTSLGMSSSTDASRTRRSCTACKRPSTRGTTASWQACSPTCHHGEPGCSPGSSRHSVARATAQAIHGNRPASRSWNLRPPGGAAGPRGSTFPRARTALTSGRPGTPGQARPADQARAMGPPRSTGRVVPAPGRRLLPAGQRRPLHHRAYPRLRSPPDRLVGIPAARRAGARP